MHLLGIAAIGFLLIAILGREVVAMLGVAVLGVVIYAVVHSGVLEAKQTPIPQLPPATAEECKSRSYLMGPQELEILYPGCPPMDKNLACNGPLPRHWNDAAIIAHQRMWNCPIHGNDPHGSPDGD